MSPLRTSTELSSSGAKEFVDTDPEGASKFEGRLYAGIPLTTLDQAHIVAMQTGSLCEFFLTELDGSPAAAYRRAKCFKIGVAAHNGRVAAL